MPAPAPRPVRRDDHVFLVDGSSYIFRAYHALPPLTRASDGLPIGAVQGFCNMLWRLVRDQVAGERPTHLAVVFDKDGRLTYRSKLYPQYKAHRPEPPDDLRPQFGLIREATRAFDIPCIEQSGHEADDLIATYARLAREGGATVTIVGSDKDLMQLLGDGVTMYDSMKEKRIGPAEVMEKFGVPPAKMIDLQALAGDSTDNVPGVPGIGVKTAATLINEYGSLEALLERVTEVKQPKRREALIENAELARLSKRLVALADDVALDTPLDALAVHDPEPGRLVSFLKAMEMTSLTRRVAGALGVDAAEVEADARLAAKGAGTKWGREGEGPLPFFGGGEAGEAAEAPLPGDASATAAPGEVPFPGDDAAAPPAAAAPPPFPGDELAGSEPPFGSEDDDARLRDAASKAGPGPRALADARAMEAARTRIDTASYETVATLERLDAWIAEAREAGVVAVDTETTSLDAMRAELVGVSLATAPGRAAYVPIAHRGSGEGLFDDKALLPGQLAEADVLARLKPLLEDDAVLKVAQNLKYDWLVLARHGVEVAPADDTLLLSYVLDAGRAEHGMDALSARLLGHQPIPFKEVAGSGRSFIGFARVPIDKATAYAAEDADVTLRLWRVLRARLPAEGMATVYETLERPLVPVIARMERRGILVDREALSRLSGDFAQVIARVEEEVYELAGERFLLGSPKQLGDLMFGKLGLKGQGKTATGQWQTGAGVLEEVAEATGHPLPLKVLEWRQLSKLKSTYTDALQAHIHPETGRVHTSFSLAATTTGRLSSSEPNLQNIPIRTEVGRKIRAAFVAAPGTKIASADYSQIELRLLAHMGDIPQLKEAFANGEDIHAVTASEVYGVPVGEVSGDLRRKAKTINFGIIYGISAFGLAARLQLGREEAGSTIKKYFEKFPGIRDYIEGTKQVARRNGYVTTLFGRRCHYPDINSRNPQVRAFNERAAINAPIQGTAADIIRRAMVRVEEALAAEACEARMLLQVHDELVFEVPDDHAQACLPVVRRVMEEAAAPAVHLSVPLLVEAHAAGDWEAAH